jgi:glycosyltransferase involved in cell wall biosynthesis
MITKPRVFIAPTPLSMGWTSMNRYRQALEKEALAQSQSSTLPIHFLWSDGSVEAGPAFRIKRLWDRRIIYPLLIRTQVKVGSVLHILDHSFADLLAYAKPGVKKVVTLHDLFPLVDPDHLTAAQIARFKRTVSHLHLADAVVCVSDYTRQESVRLLALNHEKLSVIYNGVGTLPPPCPTLMDQLTKLGPYILSVGSTLRRKNLESLSEISRLLQASGFQSNIVRVGPALMPQLAEQIRRHATLLELGCLSDAGLSAAYACASLTFIPSTLEGFGLPVLESMQAGCPVVHARTSSLSEVAGDAALSFDLHKPQEAAAQIVQVMNDRSLRDKLKARGKLRTNDFSWTANWNQLIQLYRRLLVLE